jgi:hypothetical protein
MLTKTDNPAEIGLHVFERAGLGKAPYAVIGAFECKYQACPDAPVQPGGSCDYCGTGIMYAIELRSHDGRIFKVGSDCINKAGDSGLLRAYKNHPLVRAAQRAKTVARDDRVKAQWAAIMADDAAKAKLSAIFVDAYKGGQETWLAFALRAWGYCGMSGRARYLKTAKKLLAS